MADEHADTYSLRSLISGMRTLRRNGSRTQRGALIWSYAPDWALTLILAGTFFALDNVSGYKREFSVEDLTLRFPFAEHERVPNWALYIIAFVAPLLLAWAVDALTIRSWWDAHTSALGLVLSLALTGSITQFTKITVGRPRPDVLDRCQMAAGTVDPPYRLSSVAICNQPDWYKLQDGFRSFPSGHSSLSFAGLGFLAFYTAGKLRLFDSRAHHHKTWLSLTPLAGAALVAISRTMDSRHHWQDVLTGSILGLFVSYFSYRQYYPSLISARPNFPHPPRTADHEPTELLPTHHARAPSGGYPAHEPYSDLDEGVGPEVTEGEHGEELFALEREDRRTSVR